MRQNHGVLSLGYDPSSPALSSCADISFNETGDTTVLTVGKGSQVTNWLKLHLPDSCSAGKPPGWKQVWKFFSGANWVSFAVSKYITTHPRGVRKASQRKWPFLCLVKGTWPRPACVCSLEHCRSPALEKRSGGVVRGASKRTQRSVLAPAWPRADIWLSWVISLLVTFSSSTGKMKPKLKWACSPD